MAQLSVHRLRIVSAQRHNQGFTLAEMVVVVAVIAIMFLLATQTLFRGQRSATLAETADQLFRDLRESQNTAMQGLMPQDGSLVDRSILFLVDRYVLFPGAVYDSANPENRVVFLPAPMQFTSVSFSGNMLTFARGSGEIRGYDQNADSVVLTDSSLGSSYVVELNKYGIPTGTRQ